MSNPTRWLRSLAVVLCVITGCAKPAGRGERGQVEAADHGSVALTSIPADVRAAATAGVTSKALADVLALHWDARMHREPIWATMLGDHRFDDRLPDRSTKALSYDDEIDRAALAAAKRIDVTALSAQDAITHRLFVEDLQASIDVTACHLEEWVISPRDNELVQWAYLPELHSFETLEDAEHFATRLAAIPEAVAQATAALRRGYDRGAVASRATLELTLAQLDAELAKDYRASGFADASRKVRARGDEPARAAERARWLTLADALDDKVGPQIFKAFSDYRHFIRTTLLPAARGEQEGIGAIVGGDACYLALMRKHLGTATTAKELHELGLAEGRRIDAEIVTLAERLVRAKQLKVAGVTPRTMTSMSPTVAVIAGALRDDPSNYFSSAEELLATGQQMLDRANAAVPTFFGVTPKAPCVVREVPAHEAPYQTIAYYREARIDGSKPGEYFINVYQPTTRPKFEFAALSFHEAVPGHHLQIAIAQELGDMPAFRKHMGSTAFVEGWALYAEHLAHEMGLYENDLQRLGAASMEAWRAARLVVDTGIHAFGWTRAQAVAYMREHTLLADNNIANEVDRYISWPAQALAYKAGQLHILQLRARAQATLGSRFDLAAFHDQVLRQGAVTLPVLEAQIDAWLKTSRDR
ncbi:MAG: DUF885 domain-containing protein [Myxococcales bacterium]|nr:DUF885 domain-containing protein [Myxococcales bacterium]